MNQISGNRWQFIAVDLAAAVRSMPCVCVVQAGPWPFKPVEFEDQTCRRCRALAAFDALDDSNGKVA